MRWRAGVPAKAPEYIDLPHLPGNPKRAVRGFTRLFAKQSDGLVYGIEPDGTVTGMVGTGSVAADTIWDAKGDLAAATGADAAVRLPTAANGAVLTTASAETTGLKWRLNNDGAAVAPTVNEDSGDGYSIGSRWLNTTTDREYVLLDATVGAAVWKETTTGLVPWSYAKADGGLVGDGATNDTAAFQAWITSVTASGTRSGWFFFEPGTYLISGALQDTGAFNGQILLPNVSTASAQITLTFQGPEHPPFAISGALPAPAGYAILKSNLTGSSGTASVISGGNGTWPTKNNICVVVQDLVCINPVNPSQTFWNLQITQGGSRRGLFITTTDWATTPTTQPTNTNAYGIKLPQWGQNNGSLEEIMVGGHYTGILQGELCDTHAIVGQCARAIEFPFSEHASKLHLQYTACTYGIYVTGAHIATIWLDIEHFTQPTFPAWLDTLYDLYDPSNYLTADLDWFSLDGLTQVADNKFTVSGGANVNYRKIGAFPTRSYVVMVTGSVPPDPVLNTAGDDWVYSS